MACKSFRKIILEIDDVTYPKFDSLRFQIAGLFLCTAHMVSAQNDSIYTFLMRDSVRVTIDRPANFSKHKETIITFFALPNGNTTEQTMGKE